MPWPVYSERFILKTTAGTFTTYTVPAGRRVVVNQLLCFGNGVDTCNFEVDVGSIPVWLVAIPAATRSQSYEVRIVLYAGEQLKAFMSKSPGAFVLCGYEFAESTLRSSRAPRTEEEPYHAVEPKAGEPALP